MLSTSGSKLHFHSECSVLSSPPSNVCYIPPVYYVIAGRRPLRSHSNDIRKLLVPRTHNKLGDRSFSAAGTFLRFFQTIFENTSLWQLKRLVTLPTYRRYINKCIYLSIYCLSHIVTGDFLFFGC